MTNFIKNFRDPKRHRELRQSIKRSCNALRDHDPKIDACCHVLHLFMLDKLGDKLACTIQDAIHEAKRDVKYPLPLQASRLCDLAQVLSTRFPILFLRDKEFPEKSLVVLKLGELFSRVVGTILAPQGFAGSSQDGILSVPQIRLHFPDLDPSLVLSLLLKLKFCLAVSDPTLLSLIRFGRAMKSSTTRSSSCITLFQSQAQAIASEKVPHTPSLSLTKEDEKMTEGLMVHQNPRRIPKSQLSPAPIPSSPRCEKARESCSPPQSSVPLSALKISDQLCAMGASAGGSQPMLYSPLTGEEPQIDIHQWPSLRSLQQVSVPHLTQSQHITLSTSSFEKDNYCLSSSSSFSSMASDQQQDQKHGTMRMSIGNQVSSHSLCHAQVFQSLSSDTTAKQVKPLRRRSSLVQTQHFSEKYLFFPGLVSRKQPSSGLWLHNKSFIAYSGWYLQCIHPHHFFSPRFIQTLILCLTSDFVASNSKCSSSLYPEKYIVWKNGLSWLIRNGIEVFVGLKDDQKSLLVLVRSVRGEEINGVKVRSSLIKSITDIKEECSPSIPTAEYFIDPSHLQENQGGYPVITGSLDQLIKYNIQTIAQTMIVAMCGVKGELYQKLYFIAM